MSPRPIEAQVLAMPVAGLGLRGATFGEQLDRRPGALTILVFLRHHG